MEKVTWKSAQKTCKRRLEAGPPEFKIEAESLKKLPGLTVDKKNTLDNKKGTSRNRW